MKQDLKGQKYKGFVAKNVSLRRHDSFNDIVELLPSLNAEESRKIAKINKQCCFTLKLTEAACTHAYIPSPAAGVSG